jgi:hypothetical protein
VIKLRAAAQARIIPQTFMRPRFHAIERAIEKDTVRTVDKVRN